MIDAGIDPLHPWTLEYIHCIFEIDLMLNKVLFGFILVPLEFHFHTHSYVEATGLG